MITLRSPFLSELTLFLIKIYFTLYFKYSKKDNTTIFIFKNNVYELNHNYIIWQEMDSKTLKHKIMKVIAIFILTALLLLVYSY